MRRRVRAHLQHRPGMLASLPTCCDENSSNTLGLPDCLGKQRVVDELLEHSRHGWTATDAEALVPRPEAGDPQVLPSGPHEPEDTAVRYLRAAQAVPTEHARASAMRQVVTPGPTVATPPAAPADSRPGVPTAALRPGSRADADMLIAMHARSSTETIQRRYHTPMPYLSPRLAHTLLTPEHGGSLVMTAGPDIVGIATYAPDHDHPSQHQASLLVEDRWQRRGIGARLLYALGRQAASHGIATLTLLIQPDNHPMLATIRRAGLNPRLKMVHGLLQANISLAKLTRNTTPHEHTIPPDANTTRLIPQHPPPAA